MLWLLDKEYLFDIESEGVDIVPSKLVSQRIDWHGEYKSLGNLVFKPCCSAAGVGLKFIDSFDTLKQQEAELNELIKTEKYLIQPLIEGIKTEGE